MPIRIRRHANKYQKAQVVELDEVIVVVFSVSMASYTDQKPMLRRLCGSI